jgi:hypothetical protein
MRGPVCLEIHMWMAPAPVTTRPAEEGIAFRQIAEVIGESLGVPVVAMSPNDRNFTAPGGFVTFRS